MMKYTDEIGSPFSAGSLSAVELHNKRDDDRRDQKLNLMHQKQARRSMRHSTVTELLKKKKKKKKKNLKLNETIHRLNLKTSIKNKPTKTNKKVIKKMNVAEKFIETACDRL